MVGHKRERVLGRVGRAVNAAARDFARLFFTLTLVGGQKYAFFGLPSLTLAGQNVLPPANIRKGAAVGCQT